MSFPKRALFWILTIVIVIAASELILHAIAHQSPRVMSLLGQPHLAWRNLTPAWLPDDQLNRRPNPAYAWHDENGFRNPAALARADIVTHGDSHTYGATIDRTADTWPQIMEPLVGRSVYNMAYGGYGPVHSMILWEEMMALRPKVVIEAIYAGNDLYDSFKMVYIYDKLPAFASPDTALVARCMKLEAIDSVRKRADDMFFAPAPPRSDLPLPHRILSDHSAIYGLLRRARSEAKRVRTEAQDPWEAAKAQAAREAKYTEIYVGDTFRTVFTSEYRLLGMDLEDPRNMEGRRIMMLAIRAMAERAREAGIAFHVVMIPTKETAFDGLWEDPNPIYQKLVRNEKALWDAMRTSLDEMGIPYCDVLPALRASLANGVQPYHVSRDGHPNADGATVIARAVADYLNAAD